MNVITLFTVKTVAAAARAEPRQLMQQHGRDAATEALRQRTLPHELGTIFIKDKLPAPTAKYFPFKLTP
eukprot:6200614-Pleurochrysis_carterae.AAC.6